MDRAEQGRRERRASQWFEPGHRGRLLTRALLLLVSLASLGPFALASQARAASLQPAAVSVPPPTLVGAVSLKVHRPAGDVRPRAAA